MRSMMRTTSLAAAAALFAGLPAQASDQVPAPAQAAPIVLTGGTVHTVSGPSMEADLLIVDGEIAAIGPDVARPAGVRVVDVAGKHVYPGMILADSVLGLVEVNAVRATRDYAEVGDVTPEVRAAVAINPDSELIPVTRANGILTALSIPQDTESGRPAGLVAGRSAFIQLDGWTWEDMTLAEPGVHVDWPSPRAEPSFFNPSPDMDKAREEAAEEMERLEEVFADAKAYAEAKAAGEVDAPDLRWEAMLGVLSGEQKLFAHAHDLAAIQSAVHFADKHELDLVIVGGADAWRMADRLAEQDVSVIVSNVHRLPLRRWEDYDTPYANAAKLAEAGVRFAISSPGSGFSTPHARNLPYEAAMAAAYGLSKDDALKAVTLYPAQILGMDHRLGSLEEGKDATLIVTDGDPLEITTHVEQAFIGGREIDLGSRHTQLYEKYQEKYRQLDEAAGDGADDGGDGS